MDGATRTLTGDARFHDLPEAAFTADERRWHVRGDVRYEQAGWTFAGRLAVIRESRHRTDSLARTFFDVKIWRPVGAFEIARRLGAVSVAVGGAVAEHNPAGGIPDPSDLGPIYFNWIAPAVAFDATEAGSQAVLGALWWDVSGGTGLWLRGRYERGGLPRVGARLPAVPSGNRTRWDVAFGVELAP